MQIKEYENLEKLSKNAADFIIGLINNTLKSQNFFTIHHSTF